MKISIRQAGAAQDPHVFFAEGQELGLGPDEIEGKLDGPVRVQAILAASGDRMVISGTITMRVGLVCSRCLEDCQGSFSTSFAWYCQPRVPGMLVNKDDDVLWYNPQESFIDITEYVREQVILAVPLKPLCREDCAGLCPVCGSNLNIQSCSCREERTVIHNNASYITLKQG
jgi:uncharacterized protein